MITISTVGDGIKKIPRREPLETMQRGVVLNHNPAYHSEPPHGEGVQMAAPNFVAERMQSIGGHELYPALFLFDRIDVPATSTIVFNDDLIYLGNNGLLSTTAVTLGNKWSNALIRRDPFDINKARNMDDPGKWSLWSPLGHDPIPPEEAVPNLAFQLSLEKSLIMPDANVPVDDIMKFRERRLPELMALRHHIDELCIKIANSGNDLRMANVELEKMEMALVDHIRVSKEPNWKKYIGKIEVEMNWSDAIAPLVLGGIAAFNLAAPIAAGLTGLATGLAMKSVRGAKDTPTDVPFAYMAAIYEEFGNR